MNFHGIIVQNPGLNSIETMGQPWSVNADVLNCPRLSLTLPARREVVETPFMEELRQVCTAAVYRAMQAHPEPVRVPFEVSAHAAALGIALPEAAPELKRWAPETANHNWSMWEEEAHGLPNQDDSIIMDLALEPPDGQALARAARQNGLTARLFKPDDRLAGYGWYDRMNRAANLGITVTGQEGRYNLGDIRDENKEPEDQRPEAIEFSLTCSNGQVISLPTDVVFYQGESDDIWNGGTPLVTRQSQVSIQELTELMMDAFFQANDDSDADSPDTQEDECRLVYEKTATALLSTPEEAVIATIKGAVERHVRYEVPQGMTATIRIKRGFLTQVTLEEGV